MHRKKSGGERRGEEGTQKDRREGVDGRRGDKRTGEEKWSEEERRDDYGAFLKHLSRHQVMIHGIHGQEFL